jgi:regulator of replication initiation timing
MEEHMECEAGINSIASLDISRRDLVKMLDRISYLDDGLKSLQKDQRDMRRRLSEMVKEADSLRVLFDDLFGEQLKGIVGLEQYKEELYRERERSTPVCPTPGQITLGMTEPTREQLLSIIDAIRRVSEEYQGSAPKEIVRARAESIGISRDHFEKILMRLQQASALIESEGKIKLI